MPAWRHLPTNLATSLQLRGQKVLLVDADTVTGHVATSLGLDHIRTVAERNSGRYVGMPTSAPIEQAIFGPLVKSGAVA